MSSSAPTTTDDLVRVMIVDDHEVVRKGFEMVFAETPRFEVVSSVASAEEALTVLSSSTPDVVLTDYYMTGMTGQDLVEKLADETPDVPVLVFTMVDDAQVIQNCLAAGARGVLLKSTDLDDVIVAITKVLDGEIAVSPEIGTILAQQLVSPSSDPDQEDHALTPRELEILEKVAEGLTNSEIAQALFISDTTVRTHLRRAFDKLGVETRAAAVSRAVSRGWNTGA